MKVNEQHYKNLRGDGLRIGIVFSTFNDSLGQPLLENVKKYLIEYGVSQDDIIVAPVPGSLETPFMADVMARQESFDALIALGIAIRGETYHFELVCNEAYRGLMNVSLKYGLPVIFGILTGENVGQIKARIDVTQLNRAKEYAEAAVVMARASQ